MLPAWNQEKEIILLQMSLEQYSLLSVEIITQFCEQLAKVLSRRIPENASYAARFVQLLSKILSVYPAKAVQPLDQSLRPLRRAILSQSLNRMFNAVESALDENNLGNSSVERVRFDPIYTFWFSKENLAFWCAKSFTNYLTRFRSI